MILTELGPMPSMTINLVQEREERRKKAAENREKEGKMKGMSQKSYVKSEMKRSV